MTESNRAYSPSGLARRVKRHIKSQRHIYFAVMQPGFETTALQELKSLGIDEIIEVTDGGIEFAGDLNDCYRTNLASRTVVRLIMRAASFQAENFRRLKQKALNIPWELYLPEGCKPVFSVTCRKSRLYHTEAITETLQQALRERMARFHGPEISGPGGPEQQIMARFNHDICTLSIDSSGEPLYRRGHKKNITAAPLRETTAAAILKEARFSEYTCIVDPMCGSGTFSIEAAEMLKGSLAQQERDFPFFYWPAFSRGAFDYLKRQMTRTIACQAQNNAALITCDIDSNSTATALKNIKAAGLDDLVSPFEHNFFHSPLPVPENSTPLVVLNPPYGGRLHVDDLKKMYEQIGSTIKKWYSHCGFAIITPGPQYEKSLGLEWHRKILFMNGGIKVGLLIRDAIPSPE